MFKKQKICCLLSVLLLAVGVAAQPDYAITKKGDTLRGKIRVNLMGKLRLETAEGKVNLTPEEFPLYYTAKQKQTYCSRVLPGDFEPVFLPRLIHGAITMYQYSIDHYTGNNNTVTTTTWYAEKKNIPINIIKVGGLRAGRGDRKDFFRSLIADNPAILKKFDDDPSLELSFLEALIREYNSRPI